jgi:hypothetical protein
MQVKACSCASFRPSNPVPFHALYSAWRPCSRKTPGIPGECGLDHKENRARAAGLVPARIASRNFLENLQSRDSAQAQNSAPGRLVKPGMRYVGMILRLAFIVAPLPGLDQVLKRGLSRKESAHRARDFSCPPRQSVAKGRFRLFSSRWRNGTKLERAFIMSACLPIRPFAA